MHIIIPKILTATAAKVIKINKAEPSFSKGSLFL